MGFLPSEYKHPIAMGGKFYVFHRIITIYVQQNTENLHSAMRTCLTFSSAVPKHGVRWPASWPGRLCWEWGGDCVGRAGGLSPPGGMMWSDRLSGSISSAGTARPFCPPSDLASCSQATRLLSKFSSTCASVAPWLGELGHTPLK